MPAFDIQFDQEKLDYLERILGNFPKGFTVVVSRALNRSALTFRSQVCHDAARGLAIPVKVVKKRVHQWPRANPSRLSTTVSIRKKGFSLWWLNPQPATPAEARTAHGVTTTRGPSMSVPHGFVARISKSRAYPGVYVRVGRTRFPVRAIRTPDVEDTVKSAGNWDKHMREITTSLENRLRHETEFFLAGGNWTQASSNLSATWREWRAEMGEQEFR